MNQSEDIKDLVSALAKAQAKMKPAIFNKVNPHFKNRYADFTSCIDACRQPLADNGLAIMQYCETINEKLMLVTMLAHVSGQWMKSFFPLVSSQNTSQAIGSAMTYAKRYSLSAMIGIVADDEDDDGEASMPQNKVVNGRLEKLRKIDAILDQNCKSKIYSWLKSTFNIDKIEDVTEYNYQPILSKFENAQKYMEQKKLEGENA